MRKLGQETEKAILRAITERLPEMGLEWDLVTEPPLGTGATHRRPDALATIRHAGGAIRLAAEIKPQTWLIKENRQLVINQLKHHALPGLLLADYIPPPLAVQLRNEDVFFLDAAGNAYLRDHGLFIWTHGHRDALRLKAEREKRRAFQPTGVQLIFALMCNPGLVEADYRTQAEVAGVALGTVQWVMRDLIDEGYVLRLGRFERRLVEPEALLEAWIPAYVRNLRHKLLLGRFEAPDLGWWEKTDPREYEALWGGEPAAAQYTDFLRPGTLTVYAEGVPAHLVVRFELEKNENGRIDFRRQFWNFETRDLLTATPPLLVYADLQDFTNDRAREAAERIRHDYIDGLIEQHRTYRTR